MWNWIRKKLGIKDHTNELLELNTKLYKSIELTSLCISKLEELEVILTGIESVQPTFSKNLDEIKSQIKAIPKEMLIKNVLSI